MQEAGYSEMCALKPKFWLQTSSLIGLGEVIISPCLCDLHCMSHHRKPCFLETSYQQQWSGVNATVGLKSAFLLKIFSSNEQPRSTYLPSVNFSVAAHCSLPFHVHDYVIWKNTWLVMSNPYISVSWLFCENREVFVEHREEFVASTDIMTR